ncbi:hypothetical protein MKANGN_13470 [Mycobacterium kansasii]|nr:hypothetical protein MKANGN_13470 [Mycobacterium kansasii]
MSPGTRSRNPDNLRPQLSKSIYWTCGLTPIGWSMAYESLQPTLWAGRLNKIMATRKRHSPEQIVRKLTLADRLLSEGKDTAAVCRELGVSEATYHRWRNQFGGLKAEDAKRLKDLERENATLKRLLADAELEKAALKEIARGNF